MKIEKVKARTMYMFEGQEFGTLTEAQRARLVAWLADNVAVGGADIFADVADAIIGDQAGFRAAAAPFLIRRRGPRKAKAVQPALELEAGEDGEPQVAEARKRKAA